MMGSFLYITSRERFSRHPDLSADRVATHVAHLERIIIPINSPYEFV